VGEQSFNASRTAWLAEGLPEDVPATTVDAQCGSSQQAVTLATGLVASGITDLALACGVESMSRLPIGSQISDGASAVLLTTERRAGELGLTPLARVVDSVLVGVDPVMMLLGPHAAAPKLLERNHLTMDDLDLIEINEAFASIVVSFQDKTKADPAKINPNGGAIALGHPLGATGCVLTTKAVHELRRTGGRYGLVTMCCGGGLGTATLLERI
jgi:acetyl-CoA C-acetyltransferase